MHASCLQAKVDRNLVKEQVKNIARQFFRPEFLNRLDDMVVFDPLSEVCQCVVVAWLKLASPGLVAKETSSDELLGLVPFLLYLTSLMS